MHCIVYPYCKTLQIVLFSLLLFLYELIIASSITMYLNHITSHTHLEVFVTT